MIRAIVFDLDNCLCAATEVGEALFEPALDAIRAANRGTLSDATLEVALLECWRHALDFVAVKYGFSQEMLAAGWRELAEAETTAPMRGYSDLGTLIELPVTRFLVTSGFRRLQESKIRSLNVGHLFEEIFIDAIDEPDRKGKLQIFADILKSYQLTPAEVLVVGDNPESEIEAGNRLGITTVQLLRPGVSVDGRASIHMRSLRELLDFVKSSQP